MRHLRQILLTLALVHFWPSPSFANSDLGLLDLWLAGQTNLHTWTADAIQTRNIKTFNQPLISTGKVYVVIPDRFRWELGNPPQTIAIRQPNDLFLIYPRLQRAEKYSLAAEKTGPWREVLALLEASFPTSRAQLESRFNILSVSQTNQIGQVRLQPKSPFARKFMTEIQVGFQTSDFSPSHTELRFSDGSSMRNDFSHSRTNIALADSLFTPDLPAGTALVEPGK